MLWLVIGDSSYEVNACNIHVKDGKYQLWVERSNGKGLKVAEGEDREAVALVKEAIDFAIETGEKTLRI